MKFIHPKIQFTNTVKSLVTQSAEHTFLFLSADILCIIC